MSGRLKIRIVGSSFGDYVLIPLWERIAQHHDLEILCLKRNVDEDVASSLPVVIFPEVPEMPGYLRDLDQYLTGSDIVVAFETSKLASFQALRWARKSGVPCVIVCHEFTPFIYDKFNNIRAIQYDIHQNADLFIATSHRSLRLLQTEGVPIEKIVRLPHFVDTEIYANRPERAKKFRSYVGVRPEEILLVACGSLQNSEEMSQVLRGFKLALSQMQRPLAARLKLMVIGIGEGAAKLKYDACDLGIGGQVLFLSQDPTPFWRDACSAAQCVIWTKWSDRSAAEPYPFGMLQALAAGTPNIIPGASIFDEASSGAPLFRMEECSALDVAEGILNVCGDLSSMSNQGAHLAEFMKEHCGVDSVVEDLIAKFMFLSLSTNESGPRDRALLFIEKYPGPLTYGKSSEVLVLLEEHLLASGLDERSLAELWRIKGDALAAGGRRTDESLAAYEQALRHSDQCAQAYRGLGFISWQAHSHEESLAFYKRALGIAPNDYQSLLGVGLIYRRLRMLEESVYWLGKAIDVGGDECTAMSMCVQACLEAPEDPHSLASLRGMRDTWGDKPFILRALSQVYLAQGHGEAAKEILDLMPEAS